MQRLKIEIKKNWLSYVDNSFVHQRRHTLRDVWTDKPLGGTRGRTGRKLVNVKRILVDSIYVVARTVCKREQCIRFNIVN